MKPSRPDLAVRAIKNTAFSILDVVLMKAGTIVVFVFLVRSLPNISIGILGVGAGYIVFIAYLEIAPIRVLMRDYPQIASDLTQRDRLLTALFAFWMLQAIGMLALWLALTLLIVRQLDVIGLPFLFFGLTVEFIARSFHGWIKLIYYTAFKQAIATRIGFAITVARLTSYGILLLSPALATYAWLLIATSTGSIVAWAVCFQREFHFRPILNRDTPLLLKRSLQDYGLWDHLNRTVYNTLFTVDTVVLSGVGQWREIGNYTIALRVTSLMLLIPMQLGMSLQVVLANCSTTVKRLKAINTYIKVNTVLCLSQLLAILVWGEWLIVLLFGDDTSSNVVTYTKIISIGVTTLGLCRPLISVINNYCRIRDAFFSVFLPALAFGCTAYVVAAINWGAIGMAYANIAAYTMLAGGLVVFVRKRYPIPLKFQLMTESEKEVLLKLLGRDRE